MAAFCCIFAGQFYDDLCDYHQDDAQAVKAGRVIKGAVGGSIASHAVCFLLLGIRKA